MLSNLTFPLTNSQLSEFFVSKEYTSYFHLQQAINELTESEFIRGEVIRNTTSYHLTASGESALSMFDAKIPETIKSDILHYFEEQKYELRRKTDITADYYPLKNGEYMVKATIKERGTLLLELGINVISKDQAIAVCDKWDQKSEEIYQEIIKHLLIEE